MAKALRFYLANDNGDLVSPFEAFNNRNTGVTMHKGEESSVGRVESSYDKYRTPGGRPLFHVFDDDGIHENTAPHEGASVLIKPDARYSLFDVDELLAYLNSINKVMFSAKNVKDYRELRDYREEVLSALPLALREFVGRYGVAGTRRRLDKLRQDWAEDDFIDPRTFGFMAKLRDGGEHALRRTALYGYKGLSDNLVDMLMILPSNRQEGMLTDNKTPHGQLQLWQVDVPEDAFIDADDAINDFVTALRDNPSDVPVRRLTPVQPVERTDLNDYIKAYNDVSSAYMTADEKEKRLEDAMGKYFKMDPTKIPSDALCKNIYMDISNDRDDRRRRLSILHGVREIGQ